MGVDIRYNTPITSLRALLDEGFDAIFVGVGAPRGKELDIPGRYDETTRTSTSASTGSSRWPSVTSRDRRTSLIIGVGNTAMDCCRTSRRLGGSDIKVMARRPREYFKASPWELDDAEEEGVEIIVNHAPKRFVIEDGRSSGWSSTSSSGTRARQSTVDTVIIPCDDVILAIGQENAFPWIERDLGMEFGEWDMPVVDEVTMQSTPAGRLLRRRRRVGSEEHHLGRRPRPRGGHLDQQPLLRRIDLLDRPAQGMNLVSQKMGMSEWSYHNDYNPSPRQKMTHVELTKRFESLNLEVELGFSVEQTVREVQRCLNCDVETAFTAGLHRVRRLHRHLPGAVPHDHQQRRRGRPANTPAPRRTNLDQDLYVSEPLPQTGRVMVKDENVCVHCGLCAERCPTAAWDMELFDLKIPYAASANFIPIGACRRRREPR
jgi:formate dehydrogenase beta subunit